MSQINPLLLFWGFLEVESTCGVRNDFFCSLHCSFKHCMHLSFDSTQRLENKNNDVMPHTEKAILDRTRDTKIHLLDTSHITYMHITLIPKPNQTLKTVFMYEIEITWCSRPCMALRCVALSSYNHDTARQQKEKVI